MAGGKTGRARSGRDPGPVTPRKQDGADAHSRAAEVAARLERFARAPAVIHGAEVAGGAESDAASDASDDRVEGPDLDRPVEEGETGRPQRMGGSAVAFSTRAAKASSGTEPTMRDIYTAVLALGSDTGAIKEDVSLIRQDLRRTNERMTALEGRLGELEDKFPTMQRDLGRVVHNVSLLISKSDDMENRLRRNNLRFIGIPEKAEGRNTVNFMETWLLDKFGKDTLSPFFAIERAHRVPFRAPPPGGPPRPLLLKLLHFKDRDTILRAARDHQDLRVDGAHVSIFPDFSADLQKRRAQFLDVKRRLRGLEIAYSMLYPAKLRVVALGTTHMFESPKQAVQWLDSNEARIRRGQDAA